MHEPARHLFDRKPRGRNRFSWGRVRHGEGRSVTYRLFRRAFNGKLYMEVHTFNREDPRAGIARTVWNMRIRVRDAVDAVDLAALGLEVAA